MKFELTKTLLDKTSADVALVFAFADKKKFILTPLAVTLDLSLKGMIADALKFENFTGKNGEMVSLFTGGKILAKKVTVLGLGKKDELTEADLRVLIAKFAKSLNKKVNSVSLSLIDSIKISLSEQAQMIAEGFLLGDYRFSQYQKKEDTERKLEAILIAGVATKDAKFVLSQIEYAEIIFQATKLARDLINEPAVVATPTFLAKVAKDIAKSSPEITIKVFDKEDCEKMGMEAFLGVARGSDTPPKFVHLTYKPKTTRNKRKLAIVGKAITFDTGGVSLKPEKYMTTMKMDMSGAAAVLGLFSVIASIKPDFEVHGIFAATPNLVSGSAYLPGDVLRAMNGKTIEILNTDAEGRVTLADSLSYALKQGATELIDLATLTGAAMVALGTDYSALYGNDDKFKKEVMDAFEKTGEKVWEMPLVKEYKEQNKSEVADISNLASGIWGGSITAALFLEEFVDEKPWVHIDIAGPAFAEHNFELGPKGGTGYGVATLIELVKKKGVS